VLHANESQHECHQLLPLQSSSWSTSKCCGLFYESPPYLLFILIQLFFVNFFIVISSETPSYSSPGNLNFVKQNLLLLLLLKKALLFLRVVVVVSKAITILKWSLLGAVIANQSSPRAQLLDLFGLLVQHPPPWDGTLDDTYE
jgi:hypothetical protein